MILCSGCFDGLHAGHVRYLQAAAKYREGGERFIVAVASDAYIRKVKGREPRWTCVERMETLEALKIVDDTVEHGEIGAADVIRALRPRFFVKGMDWMGAIPPDVRDACDRVGAVIRFVNAPGTHTSEAFSVTPVICDWCKAGHEAADMVSVGLGEFNDPNAIRRWTLCKRCAEAFGQVMEEEEFA
jgi:cytidyltransferase-like protein